MDNSLTVNPDGERWISLKILSFVVAPGVGWIMIIGIKCTTTHQAQLVITLAKKRKLAVTQLDRAHFFCIERFALPLASLTQFGAW